MAISKVVYGDTTLIDLTTDSITANKLLSGETAHDASGALITGTIATHSGADVSASGSIVSAPSGYYATDISKTITSGYMQSGTSIPLILNFSVDSNGLITAKQNTTTQTYPISSPGYLGTSQKYIISVSSSSTYQLAIQSAAVITPAETTQLAVDSGLFTTGQIKVAAIPSNYVGSNIARNSSSDLSASGSVVTVPSGYYADIVTKTISSGSITISSPSVIATPILALNSATGVITAAVNSSTQIDANLTSGYISSYTSGIAYATGSNTLQLTTKAATIYTPSSATQTIASGQYLIGIQTVKGDANLIPENIAADVSIFGVVGTHQGGTGVDDIIIIGDYGLCFNNFSVSSNTCISEAGTVSGNTLIAV